MSKKRKILLIIFVGWFLIGFTIQHFLQSESRWLYAILMAPFGILAAKWFED